MFTKSTPCAGCHTGMSTVPLVPVLILLDAHLCVDAKDVKPVIEIECLLNHGCLWICGNSISFELIHENPKRGKSWSFSTVGFNFFA